MESYPTGLTILKVGDFGLSKMDLEQLKRKMTQTFGLQTTAAYMAPEVLNDYDPTQKCDIWAAGVIFYELISALKHPFEAKTIAAMSLAITQNQYHALPATVSPFVQQLMNQLLNKNP